MTPDASLYGTFWTALGVFFNVLAYRAWAVVRRLKSVGVSTTGTVVETREASWWEEDPASFIEFTASTGELIRSWHWGSLPLGSTVPVVYNPLNPREHRTRSLYSSRTGLDEVVVLLLMGLASLALGLWISWTGHVPEWAAS